MRSPGAALIRARAKAPLPDLLALHLSSADIECIKHLDLCKSLESLYADNNHIKDLEGIIELRKLWRIDLNGNLLTNLHALTSFRALGFLFLERNRICFEDLLCLRDVHFLEMRLLGNTGLLKGNTLDEYRKKIVALLPNVWILDGHFISSEERQQAIKEFDHFVVGLFTQPIRSSVINSKFGSASDVWVDSEITSEDSTKLNRIAGLIEIAHKPAQPGESPDLRRLQTIVSFHNDESILHNAHCRFASSRQSPNARLMPAIWLNEVLALPRRTRIEVIVLLATFLEFRYPKVLLSEALIIRQLDCPHFPSEAIRDTVNLPPYAFVALIAIARYYTIEEELSMRQDCKSEVASPEFNDESDVLASVPPLFTTLFSTKSVFENDSELQQASAKRCQRAIRLLSNVASFPDRDTASSKAKGKREAIFRELMPLIRGAESAKANPATKDGRGVVVPSVLIQKHKTQESPSAKPSTKGITKSPDSGKQNDTTVVDSVMTPEEESEVQQQTASLNRPTFGSAAGRKPKPGDWVEVCLKQFVKIQFLSADGLFVVGALPTDASRTIAVALQQMSRVSNSVWRVNYLTKQQSDDLSRSTQQKKAGDFAVRSSHIGKLHRDSEGFHRHGAARNQGFPNHFVTIEILKDLDRELTNPSSQTKAVEIFSSTDTLDANYVLTSPDHISAQNYCAVNAFLQQRRAPRGLWSPVQQPAPYSVVGGVSEATALNKSYSLKELKKRKPRVQQKSVCAPQPDDWLEIRREMQAQLGIVDAPSTATSYVDLQPPRDDSSSLTAQEDANVLPNAMEDVRSVRERKTRVLGGGAKLAAARGWHQVATKTEFVVAPALGVSHSAPLLRSAIPTVPVGKLKLVVLPSLCAQSDVQR